MQQAIKYSEEELILLLKKQDTSAFSYLYDNYSAAIFGVITRMVEEHHLAEDILQEAFVKIWNNFNQYDSSKGRLFTWMINLTRNLTIDTLRSKGFKKQQKISQDEKSVINYQDGGFNTAKFDTIGLRKQLAILKPEQQIVIELAYFNGYTQEEIAKEIGIPIGTVKTRIRSAILELRKLM
ncbi:MAG: sigma-70 family RNA polymerase sigma factor [Bacteroidetes bacterium]|nr:sigma-70 family RNA polymerase sigma factor [Bacteroidota bacterium]MBS1757112.1 sigma-70 family RNA polymerase sigma factor [Bacteroidota bacterium]